jgi:hypothetical protein
MPVTFKIKNVTNKRNMVVLNNDAEIYPTMLHRKIGFH